MREYGKAISWAKKLRVWGHFEKGGASEIPVSFTDATGGEYQIDGGDIESV